MEQNGVRSLDSIDFVVWSKRYSLFVLNRVTANGRKGESIQALAYVGVSTCVH